MSLPKQAWLKKSSTWCFILLWHEPTVGTRLFSIPRGYKVSDDYQFMLSMKQCRALRSDVHLVRMFCSTEKCALDTLTKLGTCWISFPTCPNFLYRKKFFQNLQKKMQQLHEWYIWTESPLETLKDLPLVASCTRNQSTIWTDCLAKSFWIRTWFS